jgi:hypothetical protein
MADYLNGDNTNGLPQRGAKIAGRGNNRAVSFPFLALLAPLCG